ncbi:hypothetical protein LWI28_022246 [Acer negundo]|uniref:Uncharacterized protein n=1 Tax=Acer negundo TaxID=4023 RepID=A0AAD5NR78_ACENE|nr:hypothetical protein LWI28_022246 [Acer negundo]
MNVGYKGVENSPASKFRTEFKVVNPNDGVSPNVGNNVDVNSQMDDKDNEVQVHKVVDELNSEMAKAHAKDSVGEVGKAAQQDVVVNGVDLNSNMDEGDK